MARTRRPSHILWCTAAVIAAAGIAPAQVAPPAPPEPEPAPEYVPPAPQTPPQRVLPTRPNQEGTPATQRRRVLPPDVPFRSMAEVGDDGTIRRLTMPPHLVALKHNNTIADNSLDKVLPVLHARQIRVEDRLLSNYDLYLGFEAGLLDQISLDDIGELQRTITMLKPLMEPGDVSLELEDAGIFSASQRALNASIVQEYQKQVTDEVRLENPGQIGPLFRQIIEDSLVEPRFAFGLLVAELIQHGQEAVLAADLTGADGAEGVIAVAAEGWPEDAQGRFQAVAKMKAALSRLTPDEQVRLLQALRGLREDPAISPLPPISLSMPGVVGKENTNIKFNTIREHDEQGNPIIPATRRPTEQPRGDEPTDLSGEPGC